ncbi:MAG TPA: murein biosynthesis integral membrane protein MurJ [Bryobacteraceae bacterium]|nr:murein biosynthesis integral membrane protein MurJ [Bryobacteraceae bacterium]
MDQSKQRESTGGHAALVSAGILLTRSMGFVRQYIFAGCFGLSPIAAAWGAAFRIPNMLQTLFGEGVLSASFIPVYAKLLAEKDEREAGRVAGAVAAILALVTALIVLVGVLAAPAVTDLIVGGFKGETRELTVRLVRILFPGAGLLVLSAWCLGILNSHRKFFLSYAAPVLWNLAMIATLLCFRRLPEERLIVALAWGSVAGSGLQFAAQLPVVLQLARHIRFMLDTRDEQVREVVRNFVPVFISRGVVQISAYVDVFLASYLPEIAVAGLTITQTLYTLPVSLFGMAVSAAELPAMSSALGDANQVAGYLQRRLNNGLRQIAFFVVPSAMAFLALGGVIAATLFQHGAFHRADSTYVWGIIAGSSVGLLASTLGRLYSSTYYALRDTRTPLRFAVIRVVLTTALGYLCALPLPRLIGIDARWGAPGLTASAGIAGWVEFALLRRTLNRRIGKTGLPALLVAKLWTSAAVAAAAGWGVKFAVGERHRILSGALILGTYGAVYFGAAYLLGVEESAGAFRRLKRRR